METVDYPDLSEEWVVLDTEQRQDILEGRKIVDTEQEATVNDKYPVDFSDSTMIEEMLVENEKSALPLYPPDNVENVEQKEPLPGTPISCTCDELPPNVEMVASARTYIHKRNVKLNGMLSLCLVFTLTAGLALGLGNFWGWLSCSKLQKYHGPMQEQQIKYPHLSSLPKTTEIRRLQLLHQIESLEDPDKNQALNSLEKSESLSALNLNTNKEYADRNEHCPVISNSKICDEKNDYLLNVEALNSNSVTVNYVNEHIGKKKHNTVSTGGGSTPIDSSPKISHKNILDIGKEISFTQKLPSCIRPRFYQIVAYQHSQYVSSSKTMRKVNGERKMTTGGIPITPMLQDKDESSKVSNLQYVNRKINQLKTRLWEIKQEENNRERNNQEKPNKVRMEFVSKLRPVTSEALHFNERVGMHKWFHDHIEHIVETTHNLISRELHQFDESSESSLNTTEKVFQVLLKCLMEKLEDIQLFRSSPLFVAHSNLGQKALRNLVKAITEPINKLLKTSAVFLVQDKPLDKKLNELLKKILGSMQKLEHRWVEIKEKWLHLINLQQEKLYEIQHGHNSGKKNIENHLKNANFRKSKVVLGKKRSKNLDPELKNKVNSPKHCFGETKRQKNKENWGSKNNEYSKQNGSKHHGMKNQNSECNKQRVHEYNEKDTHFQTAYKEINSKSPQMRISLSRKADNYLSVST